MEKEIAIENKNFDFNEMDKRLFATAGKITGEKSEQLELVEEFRQEIKDIHRTIRISMEHETTKQIYLEYKRLGGKSAEDEFMRHVKRFFELTLNIWVYGSCLNLDGTYCSGRKDAWKKWALYIGSFDEADLYMQAVDNITTYS
jgi:hypothetical protein